MGVAEDVMAKYPSLSFLLGHPEIGPLLTQAVNPQTGFSPQTFQTKLYQTNWWKSQSETQRNWLIKSNTDPGSANQDRNSYGIALRTAAEQFGLTLSGAQSTFLTEAGLAHGWDPGGAEMLKEFGQLRKGAPGGKGTVGVTAGQLRQIAESQWLQRPSTETLTRLAENVAVGKDSVESINERWGLQARTRYPHLGHRLMAGETLGDIVAPLQQLVAQELERQPGDINVMQSPVWRQLLSGVRDPNTKKMRTMTDSEVIRLARSQPQWWKTSNGRGADAGMTRTLLQTFGVRAG